MTSKTMCILFSESYGVSPNELASERTLATIPFAGRYRLIDFVLSSLVKAGVFNIGILTKEHYGSLMDHLGWGKDWDLDRKNGGIKILTPFAKAETAVTRNRSKVDALLSAKAYLESCDIDTVILSDANLVMNIDFEEMLRFHAEREADITILYQNKSCPGHTGGVLEPDASGRVIDAYYTTVQHGEPQNAVFGVYIFNKELLISLLDRAYTFGWVDFERDFITKNLNKLKVYGFEHTGFSAVINSVSDYYNASMEILHPEVRRELFYSDTPILTRVKNSVPTVYGFDGKVQNSLIADGCIINGELHNCIVFRDVEIEKGAVLNNCIIMQNTTIHSGARLNCVISDKDVVIAENHVLSGYRTYPFVISKGQRV
ncbi:MAG: glucose-1-phosphate adenylyltransferase subunit GlgD [Candidatus Merdivicinus sp.]|jgi:glucose-1-phosphate adenylyltransferase